MIEPGRDDARKRQPSLRVEGESLRSLRIGTCPTAGAIPEYRAGRVGSTGAPITRSPIASSRGRMVLSSVVQHQSGDTEVLRSFPT
jgi:hypothetical protein